MIGLWMLSGLLMPLVHILASGELTVMCPSRCSCYIESVNNQTEEEPALREHDGVRVHLTRDNLLLQPAENDHLGQYTVNCSGENLVNVPQNVPVNTSVLIMSDNAIRLVSQHVHSTNVHLQMLDMSDNYITSALAVSAAFSEAQSLSWLSLSGNAIDTLSANSFRGLSNLRTLLLASNHIASVDGRAFSFLDQLTTLDLNNNRIRRINSDWFQSLTNLQVLHLHSNLVIEMEDSPFSALASLRELSLADNRLVNVDGRSLRGLKLLEYLDLSGNLLHHVPSGGLSGLRLLDTLVLDRNPVVFLSEGEVQGLSVRHLSLSYMPQLLTVDKQAFLNLPELLDLHMHDNPMLAYIDPEAFIEVTNLTVLFIHNCSLRTLPYTLPVTLRSLRQVWFYDNPVLCDCNSGWIRQYLLDNTTTDSHILFMHGNAIVCAAPASRKGQALQQTPSLQSNHFCRSSLIQLTNRSFQLELGQSVHIPCRAIGQPAPTIHWVKPNGRVLNITSNESHLHLSRSGTLWIDHIKAADAGQYTCVANQLGSNQSTFTSTTVYVHNNDIHVLRKGVATNFITITWNGTSSTISTSDYVIMYRQAGQPKEYHRISLRPYMRTYTITNLKPQTLYEFCIAFEHNEYYEKIHCQNIETKQEMFVMTGIRSLGNLSILIAVVIAASLICFLCLAAAVIKRFRRRHSYNEPNGKHPLAGQMSAPPHCAHNMETMSQIPLDNIYHPPSTPLCTSTTSLIPSSSA